MGTVGTKSFRAKDMIVCTLYFVVEVSATLVTRTSLKDAFYICSVY